MRCANAAERKDTAAYEASRARAQATIEHLKASGQSAAYEEGRLLLEALACAREERTLGQFKKELDGLIAPLAAAMR